MKNRLFGKRNLVLFGISLFLLIVAYVLLGQGPESNPLSKSVAPLILVFVYCALIPYSIITGFLSSEKNKTEEKGV